MSNLPKNLAYTNQCNLFVDTNRQCIRGYACFTLTEFTISDSETKFHVFSRTLKVGSALVRITGPTKQTIGSGASKNYAHDPNLGRLKCGVECCLRR